jgi:Zn-dependent peptidase ImmA (M78 family)
MYLKGADMKPYIIPLPEIIKNMLITLEHDTAVVIITSKIDFIAPIDIDNIVRYYDIKYSDSLELPYRGHAIVDNNSATIEISNNLTTNPKRFTIAHELGHVFSYQFQGKTGKVHYDENTSTGKDAEEVYANAFAASILVPKELLINQLKVNRNVAKIANIFSVSQKVIEYRVRRLFGNSIDIINHNYENIIVDK